MKRLSARFFCILMILVLVLSGVSVTFADTTYEAFSAGAKGENVKELQLRLKELGFYKKKIDSDYGNQTRYAVISFQSRNGLPVTGAADSETLALLYSDNAKPVPNKAPAIEILGCSLNNGIVTIKFRNNASDSIDSITYQVYTYNSTGRAYAVVNPPTFDDSGMIGYWSYSEKVIAPKSAVTENIDLGSSYSSNIVTVGICIYEYHTTKGFTYRYNQDQLWLIHSNGYTEYPSNDSELESLTDQQFALSKTVMFGTSGCNVYPQIKEAYLFPAGHHISGISENSTFDRAGIKEGDVILALDDISALEAFAFEKAKFRMLDGETVTVRYWRGNKEYTTKIAMDMDSISPDDIEIDPSKNVAEQLIQVTDLYERGLITQEEYAAAKAKILAP